MRSMYDKHLCECGRRLGAVSHKQHANAGFKRRKGHELCERCFQAAIDKARGAMNAREVVL